jgi:hypothetical protein
MELTSGARVSVREGEKRGRRCGAQLGWAGPVRKRGGEGGLLRAE